MPVRPGVRCRRRGAEPAARTSRPTTPAIRASPDSSAASTRAAAPPPGACSARPPARRWSPLRYSELHRRARRPGAAHDRPDRQRLRRQDADAAADEQLGRLDRRSPPTVDLSAGTNTVGLLCAASRQLQRQRRHAVGGAGGRAGAPTQPDMHYLGGYTRGFDTATYGPGYSCPAGTPTAAQCTAALPEMHPGILDQAGYRLLDDSQSAVWTARRLGGAAGRRRRRPGRLPVRVRPRLPAGARGPEPADRHLAAAARVHVRGVVLALLPLQHLRLREHADPGVPGQPRPARHPVGRHRLEGAERTGTAGSGTRPCSPTPRLPELGQAAGDPRHAEHPREHRGRRSAAGRHPGSRRHFTGRRQRVLHPGRHVQGLGLEQHPAGRVVLRSASAVRVAGRVVLVARLVLRLLDRVESRRHPRQPGSTTCTPRSSPTRTSAGSSCRAPAAPTRIPTRSTRPGHGPGTPRRWRSPATRGARGTRWPSRSSWPPTRPASTSPTSATTSAASSASPLGSHAVRPTIPTSTPAGCSSATFQPILRLHSSHGNRLPWDYPQPADGIAAELPAPARGARALHVHARRRVGEQRPADHAPAVPRLSRPAGGVLQPGRVPVRPRRAGRAGDHARARSSTESVWFPPGQWTDWFTGATFTGPSEQTLTVPLDRMPVFVKAGGIVPEQAPMSHVGARPGAPTICACTRRRRALLAVPGRRDGHRLSARRGQPHADRRRGPRRPRAG